MAKDCAAHLVGSVPLNSVEEAFSVCSHESGSVCSRLPDGEAGGWVNIPAAALAQTDAREFAASTKVPNVDCRVPAVQVEAGRVPGDGIEGARRRIAAAKKFMPSGVGAECGLRITKARVIQSTAALQPRGLNAVVVDPERDGLSTEPTIFRSRKYW